MTTEWLYIPDFQDDLPERMHAPRKTWPEKLRSIEHNLRLTVTQRLVQCQLWERATWAARELEINLDKRWWTATAKRIAAQVSAIPTQRSTVAAAADGISPSR